MSVRKNATPLSPNSGLIGWVPITIHTLLLYCSIQRYSVTPLSPNSGLIGWVPHCDTIHSLIRDYREKKKIMLNIEHRLMLQVRYPFVWLLLGDVEDTPTCIIQWAWVSCGPDVLIGG